MSAETLIPDAILSSTGLLGVVTDIDDDPDSPDGLWLITTDNNVNTDVRVSFGTPAGTPTVGADLQEFRALVRQFDEAQTGQPNARIELWENGSLVRAGTDETVPDGGVVVSFTWNASELGTADGSLVECKVVGTKSGGGPSARNTVEMGAVEWNAEVSVPVVVTPPTLSLTLTKYVPTVSVTDHKTVTPPKASLIVTGYVPVITATDHKTVTPPTANLVVTGYAPIVTTDESVIVIPPTLSLTLTGYSPTVAISDHKTVTPPTLSLTITGFAPVVTVGGSEPVTVTPSTANLLLTGYEPHVAVASAARNVLLAHRLDAVAAPSVTDDSSMRYSVGSLWVDIIANLVYQCVDASVGAAVWRHLSSGGSPIPLSRCGVFAPVVFDGPNTGTISSTIENSQAVPLPAAGRLTGFVMMLVRAPAAGSSVDVTLRLNGVDIVGAAFTFTDADVVGSVKTAQFLEPVALGDKISVRYAEAVVSNPTSMFSSMAYWQGD